MASKLKLYTKKLDTASQTISESNGLTALSVVAVSGTVTVLGSNSTGGLTNSAITLTVGIPLNIGSVNGNSIIDGVVIDATAGVANLVGY